MFEAWNFTSYKHAKITEYRPCNALCILIVDVQVLYYLESLFNGWADSDSDSHTKQSNSFENMVFSSHFYLFQFKLFYVLYKVFVTNTRFRNYMANKKSTNYNNNNLQWKTDAMVKWGENGVG